MMLASLLLHALAYSSTPASFERRAFGARVTRTGLSTRPHARNAAPRTPKSAVELHAQLQRIADVHSSFWNVSLSLALYNETVSIAVASGADDYAASTRLTPDSLIPMGSTTKMFSASTILQLAEMGVLSLDDPVAPLVDRYLAIELPCADEPAYCADECLPIAHCLKSPDAACKSVTAEQRAKCSYCVRHLHCHCDASSACPAHMSTLAWWDFDPRIERVTFRQLIGMTSGVLDYYYDETNWLVKQARRLRSPPPPTPLSRAIHRSRSRRRMTSSPSSISHTWARHSSLSPGRRDAARTRRTVRADDVSRPSDGPIR